MSRPPRRAVRALLLAAVAVAAATSLAGCGGTTGLPFGNKIRGTRLTVYVSVPLNGPSAVSGHAVANGAAIALRHTGGRIGRYTIGMRVLDDSSPTTDRWNAAQTEMDARLAAADPTTIGYLGDFNSGASAISIPILNRPAIVQISPASTAVGLTSDGPGALVEEPYPYYPTMRRTFARVVPSDAVQARVQIALQKAAGCRSTYVLYDAGDYDGEAMIQAFTDLAPKQDLTIAAQQSYVPSATSFVSVGQTVAQSGANCILFATITDSGAVSLVDQVAAENAHAKLFATNGVAESTFTDPDEGGISLSIDHRLLITTAAGDPLVRNPEARAFEEAYARDYGAEQPVAIDGYEAMSLLLSAIRRATRDGRRQAQRVAVVHAVFSTRRRASALGVYSIEPDGDTTLNTYGVYRVVDGELVFWKAMTG